MPEPQDWTEEDLLRLIHDGQEESLTLDYKACDAFQKTDGKRKELAKDVSAFANSAGGTIVYGMIEESHKPVKLDRGYDPEEISKETLERVINARIQQRIDGVIINPVELKTHHAGHYAYVVCVPQSDRAPHQASDKRYYKRFNFESVAMEDYEVRDVMFRQRTPEVRFLAMRVNAGAPYRDLRFVFNLIPCVENVGRIIARDFALEVRISRPLINLSPRGVDDPVWSRIDGQETIVTIAGKGRLFPSQRNLMTTVAVAMRRWNPEKEPLQPIGLTVYADSMPPSRSEYSLLQAQAVRDKLEEAGFDM